MHVCILTKLRLLDVMIILLSNIILEDKTKEIEVSYIIIHVCVEYIIHVIIIHVYIHV